MKHLSLLLLVFFSGFALHALASCGSGQSEVIVTIVPDNYPNETSWALYDETTLTQIDSGTIHSDTVCVPSAHCLRFVIYDQFGDGICCGYGNGSYTVQLNDTTIVSGGNFTHAETTYFNCPPGHDCSNPIPAVTDTMTAPLPESWYVFTPDSTGLYEISTCALGNSCDTKIYIYDHCTGLVISENNQGTTFYNDDNCANNQSLITAAMAAGQTFYIRIGDYLTSCTGQAINWQIRFIGPIAGCLDTASCNFNPLATIDDGSCVYPPSPLCPAPDLMVVQADLENSLTADNITVGSTNCYVGEGCLQGYGTRRLIRFSTHIKNIGDMDYYIGAPDTTGNQFLYDPCHQHWHYQGYAEYLMFDQDNQQIQAGFKNGFCVLDLECSGGGQAKFSCGNMGITSGCGDIYNSGLDCQWIDITDVDTGNYTLVVRVNWDHSPDKLGHYEKTYTNNWAQVCLHLYYDNFGYKIFDVLPNCATYVDCAGDTFGNAQLDCAGVCNGSHVRGDLNADQLRDTTDLLLYLAGCTSDTLTPAICNDLNGDGRITVADAARLNGCLRLTGGTLTNFTSAQTSQHICEFPYNIYNPLDSVFFSLTNIQWQDHYFDISVFNPHGKLMGYELQLRGVEVDSVINLALGNYLPDIRYSANGHITELSNEDGALFKQLAPLNFLRVFYSSLHDSTICLADVIDVVNENYEQAAAAVREGCLVYYAPTDTATALGELQPVPALTIIPNPSSAVFGVYAAGISLQGATVKVFNALGEQIYDNPSNQSLSNFLSIDLSEQQTGIYLLQVTLNGSVLTRRLMLTH